MTRKWTDGDLRFAVRRSKSINEVVGRLGYSKSGSRPRRVRSAISRLKLDTSHFHNPLYNEKRVWTADAIFRDDVEVANDVIKRFFKKAETIPYECSACPVKQEWNGLPLVLQLEHRNGKHSDNRLTNLTWLCPNCHSQTSTYAGRAKRPENWQKGQKVDGKKKVSKRAADTPIVQRDRKFDHEALVERYVEQKNLTSLAVEFSVSDAAVRKILKRAGVYTPNRYQKVVAEDVLSRWDEIKDTTKVAMEFGCDASTVRRLLKIREKTPGI